MSEGCIVQDCGSPRWRNRATGYCVKHQRRVDRHGDPQMVNGFRSIEERFLAHVEVQENGCHLWTGHKNEEGYGRFYVDGRSVPAHTWAYEHFVGPVPEGCEPDHLCRNRACVNPGCLEPVTHRTNSQRAAYLKMVCVADHPLPPPGADGHRICRPCANERSRRYKAKRRAIRGYDAMTGPAS